MDRSQDLAPTLPPSSPAGRQELDRLFPVVYEELKGIARRQRRRERPDLTINTTDVVHEAYMKLLGLGRIPWRNGAHVLAMAAQAMRRVLVNHAVARRARKRGGRTNRVPLDDAMVSAERPLDRLLAVETCLRRLETLNPRLTRVVECRVFAGMSIEETALALDASPATIKRDWRLARAWLKRELLA